MTSARSIRVKGVVQGVGFRPFVFRLARANDLAGWVLNEKDGVDIHLEGTDPALNAFLEQLQTQAPPAARITAVDVQRAPKAGFTEFTIRDSSREGRPSVRISPDLSICDDCLRELFDPADRRYIYPYINCTNCGPRFTVIESLPYDRPRTTMKRWPLCKFCAHQYHDPSDRRFHAQPVACPTCGPNYNPSIETTVELLRSGAIVAIKGIGGYHLACDAYNEAAVHALRERKFRKEKPFAVMAASLELAHQLVELTLAAESLLTSTARPIVLAPAKQDLPGIAPDNDALGIMLPYAPLHHVLFAAGAPPVLVMTSANRSSEPIAYEDNAARESLAGIADVFLIGERPIARRVDDSVARDGAFGPVVLRRSRGYAPGAVAKLPVHRPILAVGADLKNTITLVINGEAFVSQHIGDLDHFEAAKAFDQTVADFLAMYEVDTSELVIAHDLHPEYASTLRALNLPAANRIAVQHHRAHIASVLAEKEAWDDRVIGVSFDGTGYGDDGTIWGGEFFYGSVALGFERILHLRPAALPGGDAAARHPVQCAAGFLSQLDDVPELNFPPRYNQALQLIAKNIRTFQTTSMGRLFDTAAALLGFPREITFEGQAAMWLEHLARSTPRADSYPFPIDGKTLDFRPLLSCVIHDRNKGRIPADIARAFQFSIARTLEAAVEILCEKHNTATAVFSGGVFQNEMLLADLKFLLDGRPIRIWTNSAVPPNDGGISLGQAALAAHA